jgi:hypothetical protein
MRGPRVAVTQDERAKMAEENEKPFVCQECGLAYGTQITADACAGVDRQLANRRQIGL